MLVENAETICGDDARRHARHGHDDSFAPDAPSAAVNRRPAPLRASTAGSLRQGAASPVSEPVITNGQGEIEGSASSASPTSASSTTWTPIALIARASNRPSSQQAASRSSTSSFGAGLIAAQKLYAERSQTAAAEAKCICGRTDACCSLQNPSFGAATQRSKLRAENFLP